MKPGAILFRRRVNLQLVFGVSILLTALVPLPASGQDETFYKSKTIRLIVGFAEGGAFDIYSQVIARHMSKHISGNPIIVIENMPGAGSLRAANHLFNAVKPDGLTIGNWIGFLIMAQVLGRGNIEFDTSKFEWVGVPVRETPVCVLSKASGVASMEKWMESSARITLGAIAPGTQTDDIPKILMAALGLPIQLKGGYKLTSSIPGLKFPSIQEAAEKREVGGLCGVWESLRVTWRKEFEAGNVHVVLQASPKKHPDLLNVPNAIDYAKTEEARQLIRAGIHDQSAIMRLYSLPPGTPKDRVEILRKAFTETMRDPGFLADAQKFNVPINPVDGAEIETIVHGLVKLEPSLLAKLKEVLK